MGLELKVREGKWYVDKHKLHNVQTPTLIAPDGSQLYLHVPSNEREIGAAWKILEDYTKRTSTNPESTLQDLDEMANTKCYHFGRNFGYILFTAIDSNGKPVAVAPAEMIRVSEFVDDKIAEGKGMGFIYQGAHTPATSQNDTNFSVLTQLYGVVSELLPRISRYEGDNWAGVVAESRSKGPERDAIQKAGFKVLVPNRNYRPPATQKTKDTENQFVKDLVLLERGVKPQFRNMAAETYTKAAYWEEQNIKPVLDLMRKYFSSKSLKK